MFLCPKKQFTADMFLLSLDIRTKEHKSHFYQTFHFHISLLSLCSFVKKNSSYQTLYFQSSFVFIFFCLKNICSCVQKIYPSYVLLLFCRKKSASVIHLNKPRFHQTGARHPVPHDDGNPALPPGFESQISNTGPPSKNHQRQAHP